jgi:hypothetical protein
MTDLIERLTYELHQLQAAVGAMRMSQMEYFRTRSQSALLQAKAAERKVDELLRPNPQRELFG